MHRRKFMKAAGLSLAAHAMPDLGAPVGAETPVAKPNLILIIADQRRYGLNHLLNKSR